jgi:hypothetical protein
MQRPACYGPSKSCKSFYPVRCNFATAAKIRHNGNLLQHKLNMESKMRLLAPALIVAFLAASSSAHAAQCQDDVAKIDASLSQADLASDIKTEVTDLREQAVQLCGAGNEKEGLDVTAQAKAILNIE